MSGFTNPAIEKFAAQIKPEFVLGQVAIRRQEGRFELCHVEDKNSDPERLRNVSLSEIRSLAQFTARGTFRPLKSSPNLISGWKLLLATEGDLEFGLNQIYPNAVADWFFVQSGQAVVTDYRTFTNRQTGMYRITTMVSDVQAGQIIRSCCDKRVCLKQRYWTVDGLPVDTGSEKSIIPCLEPCAILLEFARKGMRLEQEEKIQVPLSPSDSSSLDAALKIALDQSLSGVREADFDSPANPRRLLLALEKLSATGIKLANTTQEE